MAANCEVLTEEEKRKIRKRFYDRNYRFRKLSKPEQRVKIAKDVIAQIRMGVLVPKHGIGYMTIADRQKDFEFGQSHLNKRNDEVRDFIEGETCEVCGIGGAFVAALKLADDLKFKDMTHSSDDGIMRKYLARWFSQKQIGLIEVAFERNTAYMKKALGGRVLSRRDMNLVYRAQSFGWNHSDPAGRLIAIMENIIDNDGTFRP